MTVQEYIETALEEIGVLEAGATPPANILAWGLGRLNLMLNTISATGLLLYERVEESFTLSNGTASYTIGSGATFDTSRPNTIEQAFIREDGYDYPVDVRPIAEYWKISDKTITGRPKYLYLDPTVADGTIYLYYTPDSTYSLHIVSQKPLTTYAAQGTSIVVPPEYEEYIMVKLAVRFCSKYGKPVTRDLSIQESRVESAVLGKNLSSQMKPVYLNVVGSGVSGTYDIEAG